MQLKLPPVCVGYGDVELACYEINGVWHVFAMNIGKRMVGVSTAHDCLGTAIRMIRAKLLEYGHISANNRRATKILDKARAAE